MAGIALAAGFTSCEDDKDPQFKVPAENSMVINTPALQDQLLVTTNNMEDKSTFVLTTSQPDYGYAAIATYGAEMSLTPDFVEETENSPANYIVLENQNPSSAVMSIRTYDLAVGICNLLGIESESDWANYDGPTEIPVYFRATCEIEGVANSFCRSGNTVSYNRVTVIYAVPTPGAIYITGHVKNAAGVENGFKEPSVAAKDFYDENDFKLYEPVIGSKLYANSFLVPAVDDVEAALADVNLLKQWRFFSELVGWDVINKDGKPVQFGSHTDNFYILGITNDFVDGLYSNGAVPGQGNWGVAYSEDTWMTMVVDLQNLAAPVVYYKVGKWDVSLELNSSGMWQPVWNEPVTE